MFSLICRSLWALPLSLILLFLKILNLMAIKSGPVSQSIKILPKSFKEDFINQNTEPKKRGIRVVFQRLELQWHIKITFLGTLTTIAPFPKTPKRRQDLIDLCQCINFDFIDLLHDTVTEIVLTHLEHRSEHSHRLRLKAELDPASQYASIANKLRFHTQEDTSRVQFPSYIGDGTLPPRYLSAIDKIHELALGTHQVRVYGKEPFYVFKEVDKPLYHHEDSKIIEQELRNLERLRGATGIVQLVAPVISKNPYRTAQHDTAVVLRGFLVEYHSNGTLRDALKEPRMEYPWYNWATQITSSLAALHCAGITHMDLKPENVVISTDQALVIIDISGIGGTTWEWVSPEMQQLADPLERSLEERQQNDIWALGKIILAIADAASDVKEKQALKHISLQATAEVHSRISLQGMTQMLSRSQMSSRSYPPCTLSPV